MNEFNLGNTWMGSGCRVKSNCGNSMESAVLRSVIALGALANEAPDEKYPELIRVISFSDDQMNLAEETNTACACQSANTRCPFVSGMAVGRFADIPDTQDSSVDFNLQIAILRNDNAIKIYSVDPANDFDLTHVSTTLLESSLGIETRDNNENGFSWLVAGDLQGRSEHLGLPSIVRISHHMQATVILGHPPMHADYIQPDESTASEAVATNFTVVPDSYYSQYQIDESSSSQSSHTHTTSHSYSSSESTTEDVKMNVPLVASISASSTQAWQQQSTKTTSKNSYTYSSQSFNSS